MYTQPYEIIKRYWGKYEVLDANGLHLVGRYVSLGDATQVVIEQKLQDKAMKHPKLLIAAEAMTTLKGESLNNWLYNTLIRLYADEMRLIMNKPSQLKEVCDACINRMKNSLADK